MMNRNAARNRLLCGAALGLGMSMFAAQPALAACDVMAGIIDCSSNTITTDTSFGANTPNDRHYTYNPASPFPLTVMVQDGVAVDGFGLAVTSTGPGSSPLTIINDGHVNVGASLSTPSAGGSNAALFVAAQGNDIIYSGKGSIGHHGTGDAFGVQLHDASSLQATIDGPIQAQTGAGINILNSGTGTMDIVSTNVIHTNGTYGILVQDGVTGGSISVVANQVYAIDDAIHISSNSTGANIKVVANGLLSSDDVGIYTEILDAAATGNIHVTSSIGGPSSEIAAATGIYATNNGKGTVTVLAASPINATTGGGIIAGSAGGAVSVTAGDVSSNDATAVYAQQFGVNGTGNVEVETTGTVTGSIGIFAFNTGNGAPETGQVSVKTSGPVTATNGVGIYTAAANGHISVDVGAGGVTATLSGIHADNAGAGSITIDSLGAINSSTAGGIFTTANSGATKITSTGPIEAADEGLNATSQGGAISVTAGDVASTGSTAIAASQMNANGTGPIDITTTGAVSGTVGIFANDQGTGGITIAASGPVTATSGRGIDAYSAGGAITIDAANVSAVGSDGIYAEGGGNVAVTTTGDIDAGATGIFARSFGGTSSVTVNGGSMAGGISGIAAEASGAGAVTVSLDGTSVSGDAYGIAADAATGAITVAINDSDVSALQSGIGLYSLGTKALTVGEGSSITGGTESVLLRGGGTALVQNAGTIGTGTETSAAIFADAATQTAIENQAGGILNGSVVLSDLDDSLTNAGTWNASGASNFGGGSDAVTNLAGGTINMADGSSFDGLEGLGNEAGGTINAAGAISFGTTPTSLTNAGTFNLAAATVTGLGLVTNSATIDTTGTSSISNFGDFTNSGTINAGGPLTITSAGAFTNSGLLSLVGEPHMITATSFTNSGIIRAEGGVTKLTTSSPLNNSGTIDLMDDAGGDVLTIDGDYIGSAGATLAIDATKAGVDKLVVLGSVGGVTELDVKLEGGLTLSSDGVLVVDAETSSANAFVLGEMAGTGLIDVSLRQEGADYYLNAAPNAQAFDPLALSNVADDMWYQAADVYGAYSANKRSDHGAGRKSKLGLWGQLYWGHDKHGGRSTQSAFGGEVEVDHRIRTERRGAQLGLDYDLGPVVLGLTGGYQKAEGKLRTGGIGEIHVEGNNIGAYAMFGSNKGFYGGLMIKRDHNQARIGSEAFADLGELKIKSFGIEGEMGYRFNLGTTRLDLGAGLARVRSRIEDFQLAGIAYDYDHAKSLRGRIGARAEFGTKFAPYIDARLMHDFNHDNDVTLTSGTEAATLEAEGRGTWGRLEAGIGSNGRPGPMVSGWLDVGDQKGVGLKAGFRF